MNRLILPEHYGTHFDTPSHFIRRGATGEGIEPEQLVGALVIIDVAERAPSDPNTEVTVADLEQWEWQNGRIPPGAFVAMYSDWAKRWPTPAYLNEDATRIYNFPGFGAEARLARFDGPERFDILPLLICTDGSVSMFGRDVRRLRPNILIAGVDGADERQWPGATLRLPHAEIAIADLRGRCVMTTYDPVSGDQDPDVLRDIVRRFGGRLCLNAGVQGPGHVDEGDPVEFLSNAMPHVH